MSRPVKKRMSPEFAGMELAYSQGKDLLADARAIIEAARAGAYRAVNVALVQRNWLLGKRIAEEELEGGERAEYGRHLMVGLSEKLTAEYGPGFDFGSLYKYVQFYRRFPILETLSPKSGGLLSWSHYFKLLQVESDEARRWYLDEAAAETWSVRTLQRNISSQYYERTLLSQSKGAVKAEMQRLTAPAVAGTLGGGQSMNDPILDEIHAVRRQHWVEAGGTWKRLCDGYDRLSAEMDEKGPETVFRELLAARTRARLAREAGGAMCVGEETGGYRAEEAHAEARRDGGAEGGMTGKDFSDDSRKRTSRMNEVLS